MSRSVEPGGTPKTTTKSIGQLRKSSLHNLIIVLILSITFACAVYGLVSPAYAEGIPVASFTAHMAGGDNPLAVQFTDTSVNATAWLWDFNDGSNSIVQNPAHVYAIAGTYNVTLTASDSNGSASVHLDVNVGASDGPILYYDDINNDQSAIDDLSGNGNDGVNYGAVREKFGDNTCVKAFNGNDYLLAPASASLNASQITIEAWVCKDDDTYHGAIARKYEASDGNRQYTFEFSPVSNSLRFILSGDGISTKIVSTTNFTHKAWNHFVATYNGSYMAIYVNGYLAAITAYSDGIKSTSQPLIIGRDISYSYLNGKVGTIRIYNHGLSQAEILQHYHDDYSRYALTAPSASFNVKYDVVDSSERDYKIYVNLSWPSNSPVSIDYSAADHTAAAGLNYRPASGTLNYGVGETTKSIIVHLNDNANINEDKNFSVEFTRLSGCTAGYNASINILIQNASALATRAINIGDFGAIGDGITDNTRVIQETIDMVKSRYGGGTVIIPGNTYLTGFLELRNYTYLYGTGGTLKLIGGARDSTNTGLITITGHDCGVLGTLTLDGNRYSQESDFLDTNIHTGIRVAGAGAYNVRLGNITANHFTMDGFTFFGTGSNCPYDVTADALYSADCSRNGVSIISLANARFGTVVVHGMNSRQDQSLCGFDVEPNSLADVIRNIVIDNLVTYDNPNAGAFFCYWGNDGVHELTITVKNLTSYNNGYSRGNGVELKGCCGVVIENAEIHDNPHCGVYIYDDVQNLRLKANIYDNGEDGIRCYVVTQHFQTRDIDLSDCHVYNNGKSTPGSYDGIALGSDSDAFPLCNITINRAKLYDDQARPTQRYGFSGNGNVNNVSVFAYVSNNSRGYQYQGTAGNFTIIDKQPSISLGDCSQNDSTVNCIVNISDYWVDSVTVKAATANGTARAGVQYVPVSNTITFTSYGYRNINGVMTFEGIKSVAQPIQIIDARDNGTLTFSLTINNTSALFPGAVTSNTIILSGKGTAPIRDDVLPGPETVEYTLSLVDGWNLISLPITTLQNNSIASIFNDGKPGVVSIWGWDEIAQDWTYYSPDPDDYFNDYYPSISNLEAGRAYWIEMNKSVNMTIKGTVPDAASGNARQLVSCWNFLSVTGNYSSSPGEIFPGAIDIWTWDEKAQNWIYYSPEPDDYYKQYYSTFENIQPGRGYWIEMP